MKKQKQNLSASIIQAETKLLVPDQKRDRDETLEALEMIPIKKQKIEKSDESLLQDRPASNFSNNCNILINSDVPNFQPTYNIYQNLAQMNHSKFAGNPYSYPSLPSFFQNTTYSSTFILN
jgi:hypothetical protein